MKVTSNILGNVSRALGLSRVGGFETTIAIPPIVTGTVQLKEPVIVGATGGLVAVNNNSMASSLFLTVANAGGNGITVITGAPGLWEIAWHTFYTANYISVATSSLLSVVMGAGAIVIPLAQYLAAGQAQQTNLSDAGNITLALQSQWTVQITVGGNGVGQTHTLSATVVANKLM